MPGRKKETAKVIMMKGNSHLSKAYLKEREESEIKVEPKGCNIPAGLNEEQRDLYIQTYNDLAEYGLATHLEASLLTRFVKAKYEYDVLSVMIEKHDDDYARLLGVRLRVSEEIRKCETDLGMNAFARMKMVVPKKEEKEETETDRLFGEL